MLVKLGRAEIPVHALQFFEAEFVGAEGTVMHARLLHEDSSSNPRISWRKYRRRAALAVTAL
jgi:hypothetical protein